jgi:hypothetical protein
VNAFSDIADRTFYRKLSCIVTIYSGGGGGEVLHKFRNVCGGVPLKYSHFE